MVQAMAAHEAGILRLLMRSRECRLLLLSLLLAIVAPLHCRRAEGVAEDPLDREAEETLIKYLRIDTSNPPGNETSGARFLQEILTREGIASELVGPDPRRQGLYARLSSGSSEKALLLLHHIDVVPVTPAEWTVPPFEGLKRQGYIWGRGALDVKSLGVAELMAFLDLKRRGATLTRDVVLLAVPDEEAGGLRGCSELLETRPDLFANVGFALNEGGSNETIVDRTSVWGIEIQEKTPLWLRLKAKGSGGHGAVPPDDGGAAAKLVRALAAIDAIERPYRLSDDVGAYFRAVGASRRDERGEVMRTISEPLDAKRIERVLPIGYRSLLRDTIAVTHISAGVSTNAIPSTAVGDVDIRLLPGSSVDEMLAKVRNAAGRNAEVEVLLAGQPAAATSKDTDLYRTLERVMRNAEPGSTVVPMVTNGTSDSRFLRARGIVTYGISPFKVNYYDAATAHGNDERIRARFFAQGVHVMRDIVRAFCTR